MNTYDKLKAELEAMKEKFLRLETDEERMAFKSQMDSFLASKTEEEKAELSKAFLEGANEACESADKVFNEVLREYLNDIYDTISWAYVAKKYFNKSRSWLCQRLNGIRVGNKTVQFTEAEKKILIDALQDIGTNLKKTAQIIKHL